MARKFISSRDNALYKELKQLAQSSQARRRAARTLLDGVHLCEAYLQHAGLPQLCVTSESALQQAEVAPIVAQCEMGNAQCIVLPDALYHAIGQVENGIHLLFVIETPQPGLPSQLRESAVLLDKLQDPGNLGSILRSAAAAGIKRIICGPGTTAAWSPKVLRAGMGAHFLLQIHENVDLMPIVSGALIPMIATSSHARQPVYALDLRGEAGWLFGHEGQGLSAELLAAATEPVAIPHLGAMESLNVAASAAICFFEQVRQKTTQ